jgi:hypothetical protein
VAGWEGNKVTFEDAWALWAEVESAEGTELVVRIHRPRTLQSGAVYHARIAVTASRTEGGKEKLRTEFCQIGGARGARTVPAALVRALTELAARLAEAREEVTQQAAF